MVFRFMGLGLIVLRHYIALNNTCIVEWLECLGALGRAWKCFGALGRAGKLAGGRASWKRIRPLA